LGTSETWCVSPLSILLGLGQSFTFNHVCHRILNKVSWLDFVFVSQ
jgi:hypothetical protein